jgi:hypothetical protein
MGPGRQCTLQNSERAMDSAFSTAITVLRVAADSSWVNSSTTSVLISPPAKRCLANQTLTSDHTDDTDQEQGSESGNPGVESCKSLFFGDGLREGGTLFQPLRRSQHLVGPWRGSRCAQRSSQQGAAPFILELP